MAEPHNEKKSATSPSPRSGNSNPAESGRVLTIHEVSEYLKIPVSSLYMLTKRGKVPGVKVGKHWRYLESDILSLWPGRAIRFTALVTALVFFTTNLTWAQGPLHLAAAGPEAVRIILPESIAIPEELGHAMRPVQP